MTAIEALRTLTLAHTRDDDKVGFVVQGYRGRWIIRMNTSRPGALCARCSTSPVRRPIVPRLRNQRLAAAALMQWPTS